MKPEFCLSYQKFKKMKYNRCFKSYRPPRIVQDSLKILKIYIRVYPNDSPHDAKILAWSILIDLLILKYVRRKGESMLLFITIP